MVDFQNTQMSILKRKKTRGSNNKKIADEKVDLEIGEILKT
jgi:hypothetical protein